ncbi:MAG: Lipid A 1-diphosphate synthase [Chlamydiae bacterium]|nr:Lipid A 1-diphosphate synthase [Chlamydiota bacterium]
MRRFLFLNCAGALLFASFFIPYTSEIWRSIDLTFFQWTNAPLKHNHFLRVFWALANHSIADWIEDVCILGFYLAAIVKTPKGLRMRRAAQLVFCALLAAATILLINRFICRDCLHLRRHSPTLQLDNAVYLSDYLTWISVKVDSNKSFPGDHATTALMFACSYAYFVRGRLALLALLYGAFLCLPRLIVGAHWLSDLVVGSGCIVLFSLTWAFLTPFADRCIARIEKGFRHFLPQFLK